MLYVRILSSCSIANLRRIWYCCYFLKVEACKHNEATGQYEMVRFTLLWKPRESRVATDAFWRLHAGADIHVGLEKHVADVERCTAEITLQERTTGPLWGVCWLTASSCWHLWDPPPHWSRGQTLHGIMTEQGGGAGPGLYNPPAPFPIADFVLEFSLGW